MLKKIFGFKKKTEKEKYQHQNEERDTECDKCEFLDECKDCGNVMCCSKLDDLRQHFIRGFGVECRRYTEWLQRTQSR